MAAAVGFVEWFFSGHWFLLEGMLFVRRAADLSLWGSGARMAVIGKLCRVRFCLGGSKVR